jgi:hypothetical protein
LKNVSTPLLTEAAAKFSGNFYKKYSSRQSITSLEEHFEFLETKFTTSSIKVGLGLARYFLYHSKL